MGPFFSCDTPSISTVIPAMDHIDEYLATASQSPKYSGAIHAALALGKQTMNRYYDKTDHSEVYRIAMGKSTCNLLFIIPSSTFLFQFSTHATNYTISRKLDGRKCGSRPHETLSVPSLIKHTPLWMLTLMPQTLRPWLIEMRCVSYNLSGYVVATNFSISLRHLLLVVPKTSLMICQLFPPLQSPTFVMNWIIISALTLSTSLMLLLGGMRSGLFILISIAWHWIIWLFLVSPTYFDSFHCN